MDVSPIDILIFSALAPLLCMLLFWFIQLLFIESYKYYLSKIKRKHMPLCRFTNFTGILFQTICHALGYTATMSGISSFQINIHYGKVKPKKEKKGIFEWVSNSFLFIGPFFLPSSLLLLCLIFLLDHTSLTISSGSYFSFASGIHMFGSTVYRFSEGFFSFLSRIDLAHPIHLGFLILLLFLGMGIRPSYIGEDKRRKVDMIYDLANIKNHIFQKPLYLLLLLLLSYAIFYLSFLLNQNWYMILFSIFGWLSIIAIIALFIAHLVVFLIKATDELPGKEKYIPFLLLPISYILMRLFFYYFPSEFDKTTSLVVMIFSTFLTTILLLYLKTNKFKTKTKMKQLKVTDGPRRTIKK